jgi:glycosyltransferase involved in cell wall biosynthesis
LRQGVDFQLVIAGDGVARKKLEQLAGEHVPGRVLFAGKIPRAKMFRYHSAADLFVFPGIRESLGLVYLEAQSCGLPVVAFDNAGVPEAVQDGKTGILVPIYAFEPFADAIKRLLTDNNMRKRMGLAAKSYVLEFHDLNKNYQALKNALESIVQDRILKRVKRN